MISRTAAHRGGGGRGMGSARVVGVGGGVGRHRRSSPAVERRHPETSSQPIVAPAPTPIQIRRARIRRAISNFVNFCVMGGLFVSAFLLMNTGSKLFGKQRTTMAELRSFNDPLLAYYGDRDAATTTRRNVAGDGSVQVRTVAMSDGRATTGTAAGGNAATAAIGGGEPSVGIAGASAGGGGIERQYQRQQAQQQAQQYLQQHPQQQGQPLQQGQQQVRYSQQQQQQQYQTQLQYQREPQLQEEREQSQQRYHQQQQQGQPLQQGQQQVRYPQQQQHQQQQYETQLQYQQQPQPQQQQQYQPQQQREVDPSGGDGYRRPMQPMRAAAPFDARSGVALPVVDGDGAAVVGRDDFGGMLAGTAGGNGGSGAVVGGDRMRQPMGDGDGDGRFRDARRTAFGENERYQGALPADVFAGGGDGRRERYGPNSGGVYAGTTQQQQQQQQQLLPQQDQRQRQQHLLDDRLESDMGRIQSEGMPQRQEQQQAIPFEALGRLASTNDDRLAADPRQSFDAGAAREHRIAGLTCPGGTSSSSLSEMVYWRDIPSDSHYESPFYKQDRKRNLPRKYLTFEPDEAGWNNRRMGLETFVVMAHAMGRTLVLPPKGQIYLMRDNSQRRSFSYDDFFHLYSLDSEHEGLDVISMEEFLTREGMAKKLQLGGRGGAAVLPPGSVANWDNRNTNDLWSYLRAVAGIVPKWDPERCVAAFPSSPGPEGVSRMEDVLRGILSGNDGRERPDPLDFQGRPTPVDGHPLERLREMLGGRTELCVYDGEMHDELLVHFKTDDDAATTKEKKGGSRMLTHFYSFVFFEDWVHDLWAKRLVRDHVRYLDEIVCAAARVVDAVRNRARLRSPESNPTGKFDSLHVRRNDFQIQFKSTVHSALDIHEATKDVLRPRGTLYVSTDERDREFFRPLEEYYDLCFLSDFRDVLGDDLNKNYHGLVEQLVAARGETFVGSYFSTFSGYVNRLRGYYGAKEKREGYRDGIVASYYFNPILFKNEMRMYRAVRAPYWAREYPVAWRDIDEGIDEIAKRWR